MFEYSGLSQKSMEEIKQGFCPCCGGRLKQIENGLVYIGGNTVVSQCIVCKIQIHHVVLNNGTNQLVLKAGGCNDI